VWPHEDQVVELRQYTLHAGRRDELIELFEREFIETQEALGMRVIGQFRDLDDSDVLPLRPACRVRAWPRGSGHLPARPHHPPASSTRQSFTFAKRLRRHS
jgi:hypothetical protein